jgi:hypothetical protein
LKQAPVVAEISKNTIANIFTIQCNLPCSQYFIVPSSSHP